MLLPTFLPHQLLPHSHPLKKNIGTVKRALLVKEFVLMIKKEAATPPISVFQLSLVTPPLLRAATIYNVMKKIP